jgi:hypothetical protein
MSCYEYVKNSPLVYCDWNGNQAKKPAEKPEIDETEQEALGKCRKTLNALKDQMKDDKGAIGKFYRCAVKRGCINSEKIGCKYLPQRWAAGFYSPSKKSITLNAAYFVEGASMGGVRVNVNWWRTMLHELVHAVDCNTTFDKDNKCLDTMLREARAYWRASDCSCKRACERAWGSAKTSCYFSEAFQPAVDEWNKKRKSGSDPGELKTPDATDWIKDNKDKWVKACMAKCDEKDGPLEDNRAVDRECDKVLAK